MNNSIERIQGKNKIFFGTNKETNEKIYLDKPTWDCNWYWSFGYLGSKNCHYHLSGYNSKTHVFTTDKGELKHITESRNKHMYYCLLEDYELNDTIKENLWSFCEQARTIYTIKDAYEVIHRGGSNYTHHPLKNKVKDSRKASSWATKLLPELLQRFWNDFGGNDV